MASFAKGLELGADLIELDIHMSRDGHLVVMHDGDVSRTTDGQGHLKDMTLAEIKKLDAGIRFGERFCGERVPALEEVLSWAKGRTPLVIEIKGDPLPAPGIEVKLVELVRAYGMVGDVMAISFHHPVVRRVKELEPAMATGILYSARLADTVGAARAALADSVRPHRSYLTAADIAAAHGAGLAVSAWVVNDIETLEHLMAMGIDSVGSDYPDRLRAYLDRVGRGWPRK